MLKFLDYLEDYGDKKNGFNNRQGTYLKKIILGNNVKDK